MVERPASAQVIDNAFRERAGHRQRIPVECPPDGKAMSVSDEFSPGIHEEVPVNDRGDSIGHTYDADGDTASNTQV